MNKVYFLLGEMTHLRYFIPLVREYNRRKISSCFLIYFSGKYNCPSQHSNELDKVCKKYNIEKTLVNDFKEKNKIIFCVEKSCAIAVEQLGIKKQNNFYVLISTFDYLENYDFYSKYAKNIIFPSWWFLDRCKSFIGDPRMKTTSWSEEKIRSHKNVCIGSPKYDIKLDREKILNKYHLTDKKKVLFLFPSISAGCNGYAADQFWVTKERRGLSKKQICDIYDAIRSLGFEVLVKSRAKFPIDKDCLGDHNFHDETWFPHTTMELLEVSDLAIMVGSSSMKECVLQKTPFINIELMNDKVFANATNFFFPLLQYEYCQIYKSAPDINELKSKIKYLTSHQFSGEFKKATETYFFQGKGSSKKIMDFVNNQDNIAEAINE